MVIAQKDNRPLQSAGRRAEPSDLRQLTNYKYPKIYRQGKASMLQIRGTLNPFTVTEMEIWILILNVRVTALSEEAAFTLLSISMGCGNYFTLGDL